MSTREEIAARPWPDCLEAPEVFCISSMWRSDGRGVVYEREEDWKSWVEHVNAYWPDHEKVPWPVSKSETK